MARGPIVERTDTTLDVYDFIIVGGGSAGSVLANRLSSNRSCRVLLLEAGRDILPGEEPAEIRDTFYLSPYHRENLWPDTLVHWSALPPGVPERDPVFYEQARVIGGGSSINAMAAIRATPDDFSEWETLGAKGWSWEEVLPFYKRLENDLDFSDDAHRNDGRIPIRRHTPEQWPPLVKAVRTVLEQKGYRHIADMNANFEDGYCSVPMSSLPTHRVSAAHGYLDTVTRQRSNLEIKGNNTVESLRFDGARVCGVDVCARDGRKSYTAREIILSAGGLRSPVLLMRSGIGPGAALQELEIEVRCDSPGVGQNLRDHPAIVVATHLRRSAMQDPSVRPNLHVALRYSSAIEGCQSGDMYLSVINKTTWHPLGQRIGSFNICLHKPYSSGQLTLRSDNRDAPPLIEFNALSDRRDFERLRAAVVLCDQLLAHHDVQPLFNQSFGASFSERVQRLNRHTRVNWLLSAMGAVALDGPRWLREFLFRHVVNLGPDLDQLINEAGICENWIRGNVTGFFHPSGTCRMGSSDDRASVVDPHGKVYGIAGLRVVDASIMPTLIRAPTNITTIMMAEKIAAHLLASFP